MSESGVAPSNSRIPSGQAIMVSGCKVGQKGCQWEAHDGWFAIVTCKAKTKWGLKCVVLGLLYCLKESSAWVWTSCTEQKLVESDNTSSRMEQAWEGLVSKCIDAKHAHSPQHFGPLCVSA